LIGVVGLTDSRSVSSGVSSLSVSRIIRGLYGNIPAFLNPFLIFSSVNACFRAFARISGNVSLSISVVIFSLPNFYIQNPEMKIHLYLMAVGHAMYGEVNKMEQSYVARKIPQLSNRDDYQNHQK
jgi:xanthine/uracil/vitamin C permease (AzgA family)